MRGSAPVPVAWERYAEPARWSQWAPQIRGVEVAEDRIRSGLQGVVRGPLGVRVRFHVDEVDASSHSWRWTVVVWGIRLRMHHDLSAHDLPSPELPHGEARLPRNRHHDERLREGGQRGPLTLAGLTVDGPALLVLGYAPVARLALSRLVRGDG